MLCSTQVNTFLMDQPTVMTNEPYILLNTRQATLDEPRVITMTPLAPGPATTHRRDAKHDHLTAQ